MTSVTVYNLDLKTSEECFAMSKLEQERGHSVEAYEYILAGLECRRREAEQHRYEGMQQLRRHHT